MDILSCGSDHALGAWSGHLIGIWDGAVSLPSVEVWSRQVQSLVKAHPRRAVYLSYERSGFQIPDDRVRKVIVDTLRAVDGSLALCAVVLPGSGFKAAGIRALVSGITMVARPKTPLRCLATVQEAHAWVAAHLPPATGWPGADELATAIAELETQVVAR